MAGRIPVQVYTEESVGYKVNQWGPTITGVVSIIASSILALFVWHYGKTISEQQLKLQTQQTTMQTEQVQAELADMRTKYFDNLTSPDENKRTLAEIGLAGYGQKAIPVVHMAMGVEQGEIRESATNVVYRLFQAEMKPEERWKLIKFLMDEFDSPNKNLRIGVVQSFVKIEPLLSTEERKHITSFLGARVIPQEICSDQEGRETIQEAAKFFGTETKTEYLLLIARCPRCGNGWLQAMLKLDTISRELSAAQRTELQSKITEIRRTALEHLRDNITDKDLILGTGFAEFMSKGEVSISFEEFKRRIDEEFNRLLQTLSVNDAR
jgi:hypothetical protein